MSNDHNAHGQYWLWEGSVDHYPNDEVEAILQYHDGDWVLGVCEGCGQTVHTGTFGYNEQVISYVRYGPYFICSECILDAVDLPELPYGHDWRDGPKDDQ